MVYGRSLWLWGQRHLLRRIAKHLLDNQWTILVAPDGVTWPSTDNSVIRLNFHSKQSYDLRGG